MNVTNYTSIETLNLDFICLNIVVKVVKKRHIIALSLQCVGVRIGRSDGRQDHIVDDFLYTFSSYISSVHTTTYKVIRHIIA